jgi:HAE1 family hydrophobic/amphiphilic exporter-1/multidrug efflux pump
LQIKREQGKPKLEAILEASEARLRPILMTSLAISLGALPIAMSLGAASTSRIGMGVVIVGGTIFLSSNFICYSCTLFYVV